MRIPRAALTLLLTGCSSMPGASPDGSMGPTPDASAHEITVTVRPAISHVAPSATLQLTAMVTGTADTAVTWSASAGAIDPNGLFTAPGASTVTITATSHADPTAAGTATVIVSIVTNCASLPAAGTWETISPPGFSDTCALALDPFDSATLWLGANNGGIFESTDCGATWTHVNTGRNGVMLDTGGPVSMAVDPVDRGTIYVAPIYGPGGVWKSTNGGVDWDQLFPGDGDVGMVVGSNHFDSVSMDPNNHLHLIFGTHASCEAPYGPACEVETTDGGATHRLVHDPAPGFEEGGGPWVLNATSWLYGGLHLWLTEDSGQSWTNLDPDPAQWFGLSGGEVEVHPIVQTPDGAYFLTTGQGIIRSTDDAHTWSLIPSSGGQTVGLTMAGDRMYSSNEWSSHFHMAMLSDTDTWAEVAGPTGFAENQGCPFVQYDPTHHVLYASCFESGLWRLVVE